MPKAIIKQAQPGRPVKLDGQVEGSGGRTTDTLSRESISITDRAIGLREGTEIEKDTPGWRVTRYGNGLGPLTGKAPDVEQNPYNFVEIPAGGPWLDEAPQAGHVGHKPRTEGVRSGRIHFSLDALTPVFVPKGQSERNADAKGETDFFRLPRAEGGGDHYAIHGASLKGVLRAGVEAVSNDRFAIYDKEAMPRHIPYRRRVYADADTESNTASAGVLAMRIGEVWMVNEAAVYYVREQDWRGVNLLAGGFSYRVENDRGRKFAKPGSEKVARDVRVFRGNLLNSDKTDHQYTHVIIDVDKAPFQLPPRVWQKYQALVRKDPHYHEHYVEAVNDKRDHKFFKYLSGLPGEQQMIEDLGGLATGDLIYFTFRQIKEGVRLIDSFGKNINYLWPAEHSLAEMLPEHFREPDGELSLRRPLGIAERLFGFAAKLDKEKDSHPFRGKIRIETLWGPPVESAPEPQPIQLAALTSPSGARAKSRPLYLEGKSDGKAASYSDPQPRPMGRKFYWHQRAEGGNGIWPIHQSNDNDGRQITQLPPPIHPLPSGTKFTGRIHFTNLSDEELGALLFVLGGIPVGPGHYDHCLKIGKGKPRGMGSVRPTIERIEFRNPVYYDSLEGDAQPYAPAAADFRATAVASFLNWCAGKAAPDQKLGHIEDFKNLHTWPAKPSIRAYPINFAMYGWLPDDNRHPDEPRKGALRPKALPRARKLNPICP